MTLEEHLKSNKPLPLHTKTVLNLVYTTNYITEQNTDVFKNIGLSMQQYNVLRILRGQQGKAVNMSTIQERMIHKKSNTTRIVDKLVSKNLVSRMVCPSNRRKMEILITAKGMELLAELDPITENANMDIVKNLNTQELETLNYLLDKLK